MKNIMFISHCLLNTSSKVKHINNQSYIDEEKCRKDFLKFAIENNICLYQLPCPEFTLYGVNRWGHTRNQFDNPFFKEHCKNLLSPIILEMKEYMASNEHNIIGIVGINGSPSCGIDFSFDGNYGGSLTTHQSLSEINNSIKKTDKMGVFMDILNELLKINNLNLNMYDITTTEFSSLFR